jgi:A/G-specific adenine glycosylase
MMLQQTQVDRVKPKYIEFVNRFPDMNTLSEIKLEDVLRIWIGLGYNRRARYLYDFSIACKNSIFPDTVEELSKFKGIGANTASAVIVYSFNKPIAFIETNIRTVFFHHFYGGATNVADKEILEIVRTTLDFKNPREWYWALMDYGSYLKRNGVKNTAQSKHYTRQSAFEGSDRQLRGRILELLLKEGPKSIESLEIQLNDQRVKRLVLSLKKDKLASLSCGVLSLP